NAEMSLRAALWGMGGWGSGRSRERPSHDCKRTRAQWCGSQPGKRQLHGFPPLVEENPDSVRVTFGAAAQVSMSAPASGACETALACRRTLAIETARRRRPVPARG